MAALISLPKTNSNLHEAGMIGTGCAQDQLSARSAEGRKLRRKVLRGTVLVCIVAGYHGKRFIYERAKELGIRCIVF